MLRCETVECVRTGVRQQRLLLLRSRCDCAGVRDEAVIHPALRESLVHWLSVIG
eukprot:SAG22_NODE_13933_length_390_cov_1.065292_1_plen_53_part_01